MPDPAAAPAEERPLDEMVDGKRRVRPHWRMLLGTFAGLGDGALAERARRLDRAFEDEGISTTLPGSQALARAWRCDPVPLILTAEDFAAIEQGIAQRAALLEALLADLYGPQAMLAEGLLPPALVFANPGFLRPCRDAGAAAQGRQLQLYAADLARGPDGRWRVLADRCGAPSGLALARENRRLLAQALPEAFRQTQIRSLRPFFDIWQDSLQRLAPEGRADPAIALLTRGTFHPRWFEDLLLSRELSCALVESGDLTVRGGALFLKTLSGLQPVDVLLSRVDGAELDPLEFAGHGALGVPGLLDAARGGAVRILNAPGAAAAEAPALAAFLPALARRLLGEELLLPSLETRWLGDPGAAAPASWRLRPAADGRRATPPAGARGWELAASAPLAASVAPCVQEDGRLSPLPFQLRVFALCDGARWHVMPGGLARVAEGALPLGGALPTQGLAKDVWVLSEDGTDIIGPAAQRLPPLPIRRTAGALPSRVADNLFWLGRYTERLERAARLVRATLRRLNRGVLLPREAAEVAALARCLVQAGLIKPEDDAGGANTAGLIEALLRTVREKGAIAELMATIAGMTERVRDRLTGDMHATFTQTLRAARADGAAAGQGIDALYRGMVPVLRFSSSLAGVAAENMVRGGAWLFLDLGRRIERAQEVAAEVAFALDAPPARIEAGLRLVLELCDSVITYRSRYLTVLQPAPALDLVLADESNPRALAFQLAAIQRGLSEVAGPGDAELPAAAGALLAEVAALIDGVLAAPDQAVAASLLPRPLLGIAASVGEISDRMTRRYFALLPAQQTLGLDETAMLRGAA